MTKVIVYIATSEDGFIADEKGSVDWLPQTEEETGGEDYGYHASMDYGSGVVQEHYKLKR